MDSSEQMIFADLGGDALPALAFADRNRLGRAADDLHQASGLAYQVRAFLHRGAVRGGASAHDRFIGVVLGRGGLCRRGDDGSGQTGKDSVELDFQRATISLGCPAAYRSDDTGIVDGDPISQGASRKSNDRG